MESILVAILGALSAPDSLYYSEQYSMGAKFAKLALAPMDTIPWANLIDAWMGAAEQTLGAVGAALAIGAVLRKPLIRLLTQVRTKLSALCVWIRHLIGTGF